MAADLFSALKAPEPPPPPAPSPSEAFKRSLKPVPPLVEEGHLVFRCALCRGHAHFGFRCDTKRGELGIWFCAEHKDLGQ